MKNYDILNVLLSYNCTFVAETFFAESGISEEQWGMIQEKGSPEMKELASKYY